MSDINAEKANIQYAVVLTVDNAGKISVQDGKELFGEQVVNELSDDVYAKVIKEIHQNIERTELVAAVKQELEKGYQEADKDERRS